jgi:hypothetical protein
MERNVWHAIREAAGQPIEISSAEYWDVVAAMPPIYAENCLGCSEPYSHDAEGRIITVWVRDEGNGKYYGVFGTQRHAVEQMNTVRPAWIQQLIRVKALDKAGAAE